MKHDRNSLILQVGVKSLLINESREVLMLKKNPKHFKGASAYWDIPGGRIDKGVDLLTNLRREVLEEAGISRVTPLQLLSAQDIVRPGLKLHVVRLTYLSRVASSSIVKVNGTEHTDFKWVKVENLLRMRPLDPFLRTVLKDKRTLSLIQAYK